jgi:hypothetical protein
MGDDMGCDHFAYLGTRLDFLNLPFLGEKGAKVFSQAELIYYPAIGRSFSASENVRASMGFGLSWPLSHMINFGIAYNAVNFNSKVGDIERSSIISWAFNFF